MGRIFDMEPLWGGHNPQVENHCPKEAPYMPSHFLSVGCYSDRHLNVDLCFCFLCISPKLDLGFTTGLNFLPGL